MLGKRRVYALVALLAIVALGLALRLEGIRWGIPTPQNPHTLFHPDEPFSMKALSEMNWVRGPARQISTLTGQRDGTVGYYLWTGEALVLRALGMIRVMPHQMAIGSVDYFKMIFYGRCFGAVFNALGIAFVFFSLTNVTRGHRAALFGAFIFAIIPFECFYAHYMRPHVMGDAFLAFALFAATLAVRKNTKLTWLFAGVAFGLATACRYNIAPFLAVPYFFRVAMNRNEKWWWRLVNRDAVLLGVGAVLGFFVGDPAMILDYATVRPYLATQAGYVAKDEFSLAKLLDLSRVWTYVGELLRFGTLPLLWVVFYASCAYGALARGVRRLAWPLLAAIAIYLYPMAKGYADPVFIRALLPLFPVLAFMSGLVFDDICARYGRGVRYTAVALTSCIAVATLVYDWAYVSAMGRGDARLSLAKLLKQQRTGYRIGEDVGYYNYFTINAVTDHLPGVRYVEQPHWYDKGSPTEAVDYVIHYDFQFQDAITNAPRNRLMIEDPRFRFMGRIENPIQFGPIRFDTLGYPHDLNYPFPRLYLYRTAGTLLGRCRATAALDCAGD